ncbi:hypothetical protein K438DRAFT_1777248 [Mycena galopus ATCC 62051]|nr:hypothetical protein K438DRAFT_1777248 [Mycena galopus ATCC 62051]
MPVFAGSEAVALASDRITQAMTREHENSQKLSQKVNVLEGGTSCYALRPRNKPQEGRDTYTKYTYKISKTKHPNTLKPVPEPRTNEAFEKKTELKDSPRLQKNTRSGGKQATVDADHKSDLRSTPVKVPDLSDSITDPGPEITAITDTVLQSSPSLQQI